MNNIIQKIFKEEHIKLINFDHPDQNFPTRIKGISCSHCGKTYYHNAEQMFNHLQYKHNLLLKEIIK